MPRALIFAGVAAVGNALFVYGQRRASIANNPFVFMASAVIVCSLCFAIMAVAFRTHQEIDYLSKNLLSIVISGVGFFVTFIGFYFLYSQYGAVYYVLYAVLSIITTSIGVGIFIFKEPFNAYQFGGLILATLSIVLFSFGQTLAK